MSGNVPRHMSLMVIAEPTATAIPLEVTPMGIVDGVELIHLNFEVPVAAWEQLQEMAAACGIETRGVFDRALSLFVAAYNAKASGEGYIAIIDRATETINPCLIPEFMALERLHNSKQ